jgi:hypothetical protein
MLNPWVDMMQAMAAASAPNLCAPQKAGVNVALPWPWGPMWSVAMDPNRNPWLAYGMAFGPVAWFAALNAMNDEDPGDDAVAAAALTESLVEGVPV